MSFSRPILAGVLLALALVPAAAAPQSLGAVQGFVTDDSGAALPGVALELLDLERGQSRSVTTNSEGFFAIRALPNGEYDLTASLAGFRTARREHIHLHVGQTLDADLQLHLASVEETVVVTAEAPLLDLGRGGAGGYVDEVEISALPISGRDFVQFALLKPTVKVEPQRGGISLSGQRGINSGLTIDGADAKSAFFGYGRGGEATENGGLVVAQESVQEFEVVTSGYSAEAGRSGGGYINVVTKAGTNDFSGSGFLFFRDNRMVATLPQSPLDASRGIAADDDRYEVDEFERYNWGASFGGPIARDRTHFFLSYDQTARSQPFLQDIRGAGQYDAILARYPDLLAGFSPNGDGTASGQFVRGTDNLILFGKLNHRVDDRHSLTLRYNFTDFARTSDYVAEESRKLERTHAVVGSLVSLIGDTGVNEFRVQYARDDLDRLANLPDGALQANFRIFAPSFSSFGKPWWLPIYVDEQKFEVTERFSFLSGNHEIRLGLNLSQDLLTEYFAGNADGRYDFDDVADFMAGDAARARIFFGNVDNPNFDVAQQTLGLYAQDSWSPNSRLTLNYGARWDATLNPGDIQHVLPEGTGIPNDLDNFSPRAGFVWSLDEASLIRGGAGVFYGRTPTLLFFSAYSNTGVFPNYGNAIVAPGETGFVPLGAAIDNANPPAGLIPALSYVHPDFEDPRTARFNFGYEREIGRDLAASLDFVHARGDLLASNVDANVAPPDAGQFRSAGVFRRANQPGLRHHPGTGFGRPFRLHRGHRRVPAALPRRHPVPGPLHLVPRPLERRQRAFLGGPDPHRSLGPGLRLGRVQPGHPAPFRGERGLHPAFRHPGERDPHRPVGFALHRPRRDGGLPQPPRLLRRAERPADPRGHLRGARAGERRAERQLDESRPPHHQALRPRARPDRGTLRSLQCLRHRRLPGGRRRPAGTFRGRRRHAEPRIRPRQRPRRQPAPGPARPPGRLLAAPVLSRAALPTPVGTMAARWPAAPPETR